MAMKFIYFILFYYYPARPYPARPSNSPPLLSFSLYPVDPRYNSNTLLRLHTPIPVVYFAILIVANPTLSNNPLPRRHRLLFDPYQSAATVTSAAACRQLRLVS